MWLQIMVSGMTRVYATGTADSVKRPMLLIFSKT